MESVACAVSSGYGTARCAERHIGSPPLLLLHQEEFMLMFSRRVGTQKAVAIGGCVALGLMLVVPTSHATAATAAKLKCGLGNGKKATGAPIKIGAVMTNVPGIEFQDGPNTQKAYFQCVNDNGGINARFSSSSRTTRSIRPRRPPPPRSSSNRTRSSPWSAASRSSTAR